LMLEKPGFFELYGALKIHSLARVVELQAVGARAGDGLHVLEPSDVEEMAPRLAIVVPIKDDEIISLANVASAIPHASPLVIVSASSREPVDRFRHEKELAKALHEKTGRGVLVLHQRDPAWGRVLRGTPLEALLDEEGLVRYGKGEGMLLGFMASVWLGARYVGFIDSDNYVPGSVLEYATAYMAGFKLATSQYAMVRIKWPYKGKLPGVGGDIYLRRRGRVSMHTNKVLNLALSVTRGIETEIIQTANSGEHALTRELGLGMEWAGGFAVEPYQLVSLLRDCWLEMSGRCTGGPAGVEIVQVETRNPHLHAERGDEHLASMLATSLGTVYHSPLATPRVREEILRLLEEQGYRGEPPAPRVYPPPGKAGPEKLVEELLAESRDALLLEPRS
jgi:mannosyl-3-phosphoglycerate synthase